jgi:predicted O-methyltransferase YrrM
MEWDRLTRTHFWPETITFLREKSRLLPENAVVVNIGAYWESSTICLLIDRPDAFAFSIDPEICETGLDNLRHFGLSGRVVRVLGKSQDIAWRLPIDAVYIDGDHSYEACKADIENWVPWVKKGGLIFFHDYGTPHTPGVVRAVDEMMGDFEYLGKDLDTPKGVLVAYRK